MICSPKIGDVVKIWYGKKWRTIQLHDKLGVVRISGKGKPRNHGIEIDGTVYVIPCGNLIKNTGDK